MVPAPPWVISASQAREQQCVRHEVGDQDVRRLRSEALGVGARADGHDHVHGERPQAGEDGVEDVGEAVEDRAERQVNRALVGEGAERRVVPRQPLVDEHLPDRRPERRCGCGRRRRRRPAAMADTCRCTGRRAPWWPARARPRCGTAPRTGSRTMTMHRALADRARGRCAGRRCGRQRQPPPAH